MLLLILAAIWAAVLLPPWLQNRRERRPNDSIVSFRSQMGTLQRATPGAATMLRTEPTASSPWPVMSRREARARRRDILVTLVSAAALTLFMAIFLGGAVLALHLLVDVLLVGYVVLLLNAQQSAMTRRQHGASNVHRLPTRAQAPRQPALQLRRTGS